MLSEASHHAFSPVNEPRTCSILFGARSQRRAPMRWKSGVRAKNASALDFSWTKRSPS
jgi:hypothetical protein